MFLDSGSGLFDSDVISVGVRRSRISLLRAQDLSHNSLWRFFAGWFQLWKEVDGGVCGRWTENARWGGHTLLYIHL